MNDVREAVRGYILEAFLPGEKPEALSDHTPLVTGGILDSLASLKLVAFLEESYGIDVQAHEANVDNLDTISAIEALVRAKLPGVIMDAQPVTTAASTLVELLAVSASTVPARTAVEDLAGRAIEYGALDALSSRLRDRLSHLGVGPGDRVGICLEKSIDSVVAIFGIMKRGAAYVPVDASAPPARNGYIFADCSVKAVITDGEHERDLRVALDRAGHTTAWLVLDRVGGGQGLDDTLRREQEIAPVSVSHTVLPSPDDLAYILYTSGSTGHPKGVMLSHRNAVSFVDWCSDALVPRADDRFSSHAPFHFDLSILDLYVPLKHGATLILFDEMTGKEPVGLASAIADKRITVWYSTPSVLSLLAQYGKLDRHAYGALRTVVFAGEVFPVKYLRLLKSLWPSPRYFNLYGPTETNVCTFFELPAEVAEDRREPYPIGQACSHCRTTVVNEHGHVVPAGQEGELLVAGPSVMQGYWRLPERTSQAFHVDAEGQRWYRTGDIVIDDGQGVYRYVGRRDRMVKRRGYRIELGEIEAGLYRHPAVREAAALALTGGGGEVQIGAFLSCRDDDRPSIVALKRFCAENLPLSMVPDRFYFLERLPQTSTDKIDYQRLKELV